MSGDGEINAVRGDVDGARLQEEAGDIGPKPCWSLSEYCQQFGGMLDVVCFWAMAVDSKNIVMSDLFNFQRKTALGALK